MPGQPLDVPGISEPGLGHELGRQFIELLLEEPSITMRRLRIPAPDQIAEPEYQEQVPIHAPSRSVTQIGSRVHSCKVAFGSEGAALGEGIGASYHTFK